MADLKTLNTTYPVSKDTASPVVTGDAIVAPLWNGVLSAVIAIENELGVGLRGTATDLATRLSFLIAANGSLRSGTSFPAPPPAGVIDLFFRTDLKQLFFFDPVTASYIANSAPTAGSIVDAMIASTGITTRSKLPAKIAYEDEENVFTLLNRFTQELNLDGNLAFKSGTLNKMTLDHAATVDRTVTFPDATDTVAMVSLAQTLLNKTLTDPAINGGTIFGAAIIGAAITGGTVAGAAITGGDVAGATITGGDVAAGQLTGLASIPASAGIIPAANLPTVTGGLLLNVQIFSASGTWTKPVGAGNVVCDCIIVGAGGGGGSHRNDPFSPNENGKGGDGGLGGRVSAVFGFVGLPVISDLTLPVVVGIGGAGGIFDSGSASNGAVGGVSSFNGIVCGGGDGGVAGFGSLNGANGANGASPQGGVSPTFNPTTIPHSGYNGGIGVVVGSGTAGSNGVVIIRTYSV